jgi:hypothetical protein
MQQHHAIRQLLLQEMWCSEGDIKLMEAIGNSSDSNNQVYRASMGEGRLVAVKVMDSIYTSRPGLSGLLDASGAVALRRKLLDNAAVTAAGSPNICRCGRIVRCCISPVAAGLIRCSMACRAGYGQAVACCAR